MDKRIALIKELEDVVSAGAWYGAPVMEVLGQVNSEIIHQRVADAHTIAELLFHMTAWTEEAVYRLAGQAAGEPRRGDWPEPGKLSWAELVALFASAHHQLLQTINHLPADKWEQQITDNRGEGVPSTHEELVRGLIQHHIYHAGQIAILNKQFRPDRY